MPDPVIVNEVAPSAEPDEGVSALATSGAGGCTIIVPLIVGCPSPQKFVHRYVKLPAWFAMKRTSWVVPGIRSRARLVNGGMLNPWTTSSDEISRTTSSPC